MTSNDKDMNNNYEPNWLGIVIFAGAATAIVFLFIGLHFGHKAGIEVVDEECTGYLFEMMDLHENITYGEVRESCLSMSARDYEGSSCEKFIEMRLYKNG